MSGRPSKVYRLTPEGDAVAADLLAGGQILTESKPRAEKPATKHKRRKRHHPDCLISRGFKRCSCTVRNKTR